ncbi:hypothetical protein [Inquilinus sp. CAU 1745]|uniref:hypothetical protein n=1 Tax=Inquilinus sp. CAU 1745 TaxID=3140369 RepID=UPI00325AD77F
MFPLRQRLAVLALAPIALAAAPAAAFESRPVPIMDQVVLSLSAEDWVEAEKARVIVAVDAALPGSDAASVRTEMLAALDQLAADAEWRFLSFDRFQDESGLERWRARAEARLPETALGGIADRAEDASRPGLQVRVENTDFSPTLAEIEAVEADLRTELYERASEELDRLNQVFPDRDYRVASIDFLNQGYHPMMDRRQPMMAASRAEMAPAPEPYGGGLSVSQKLTLTAQIVLQVLVPQDDTDDSPDGN